MGGQRRTGLDTGSWTAFRKSDADVEVIAAAVEY